MYPTNLVRVLVIVCCSVLVVVGFPYPQVLQGSSQYDDLIAQASYNIESKILASDESSNTETTQESDDSDPLVGSQTFYPSYFNLEPNKPPLGHSRPFVYNQETAYSHRPYSARQQQLVYDTPLSRHTGKSESSGSLLGSGNFGVIRGGTFYNEKDEEFGAGNLHSVYEPYYRNNGHGRPSYYYNPKPVAFHEQFSDFTDFADINAPSNSAYSELVVVYANKNGTIENVDGKVAKNIIETLAMLDKESTTTEVPLRLSKSKRKLALLPPEKKPWGKKKIVKTTTESQKDLYEPLLALS